MTLTNDRRLEASVPLDCTQRFAPLEQSFTLRAVDATGLSAIGWFQTRTSRNPIQRPEGEPEESFIYPGTVYDRTFSSGVPTSRFTISPALPAGAVFDAQVARLSWAPSATDLGIVWDGLISGTACSQDFGLFAKRLRVLPGPTTPVVSRPPEIRVREGESFTFPLRWIAGPTVQNVSLTLPSGLPPEARNGAQGIVIEPGMGAVAPCLAVPVPLATREIGLR